MEFSVTGIGLMEPEDDREHNIQLIVTAAPFVDGNHNIWVWDTTEVPSGITFKPKGLAGTIVSSG